MFAFGNLGNTCYMNTALQCLMRLPPLNALLDRWPNPGETPVQKLVKEYNELRVMALTNDGCTIKPGKFNHAMQTYALTKNRPEFASHEQQDSVEYMQFLLNCIHEAMAQPIAITEDPEDCPIGKKCREMMRVHFSKEYSEIVELFYGMHVSTIHESHTPEVFLTLDLPIPAGATTLVQCVEAYTAKDTITWLNEETRKEEPATKQLSFWRMPTLLIVCLKRFDHQGRKNAAAIEIPRDLTICDVEYELRATVLHNGGTHSGHYAACAQVKGHWVVLDDETVYPLEAGTYKQVYCAVYEKQ